MCSYTYSRYFLAELVHCECDHALKSNRMTKFSTPVHWTCVLYKTIHTVQELGMLDTLCLFSTSDIQYSTRDTHLRGLCIDFRS
jgi:hypothetical protein